MPWGCLPSLAAVWLCVVGNTLNRISAEEHLRVKLSTAGNAVAAQIVLTVAFCMFTVAMDYDDCLPNFPTRLPSGTRDYCSLQASKSSAACNWDIKVSLIASYSSHETVVDIEFIKGWKLLDQMTLIDSTLELRQIHVKHEVCANIY